MTRQDAEVLMLRAEVERLRACVEAADGLRLATDGMYHGTPEIQNCPVCMWRKHYDAARAALGADRLESEK